MGRCEIMVGKKENRRDWIEGRREETKNERIAKTVDKETPKIKEIVNTLRDFSIFLFPNKLATTIDPPTPKANPGI